MALQEKMVMSSKSQRSIFDPDVMTEEDIEKIWWQMKKDTEEEDKVKRKLYLNLSSTDTTPTTDYNDMRLNIPDEGVTKFFLRDKEKCKTDEVLNLKKRKPKTYLTQVILYDNVSHNRILQQKLGELQHRHKIVEKRIKRRKQTFLQHLEKKQNEWAKLDATVVSEFEPEKMPDLTFKFGRLYHNANYPYQAAVKELRGIPPPKPKDITKPTVLPQITRRKRMRKPSVVNEKSSGSDDVFITKLPQKTVKDQTDPVTEPSEKTSMTVTDTKPMWETMQESLSQEALRRPKADRQLPPLKRGGRRGRKEIIPRENWLEDSRYITLTSILGPRFSASRKLQKDVITSGVRAPPSDWW